MVDEQTSGLLGVVTILRVALIVWAAIVVAVDINGTTPIHGFRAVVVLIGLTVWTAGFASLIRTRSEALARRPVIVVDLIVSAIAAAADPFVYPGPHPQSFPSAWPLSGAVVVGITRGRRAGALAGLVIGAVGAIGVMLAVDGGIEGRLLGSGGTIVLLAVSGFLAGVLSDRIREVELTRARAQIREETARQLHDGVLQTLAVVQRRSDDTELVRMARDQEVDLRAFIATPVGSNDSPPDGADAVVLSDALRRVLRDQERRFATRVELLVVDEPPVLSAAITDAVRGAVAEAVANASKHGGASLVRVFVDTEDDLLHVEVRDDGSGFDTTMTSEGTGITRSIRGRVSEVGGSVGISSGSGSGTNVTVEIPVGSRGRMSRRWIRSGRSRNSGHR